MCLKCEQHGLHGMWVIMVSGDNYVEKKSDHGLYKSV